jgi:hypothetical protein
MCSPAPVRMSPVRKLRPVHPVPMGVILITSPAHPSPMKMETGFGWIRIGKTTYDHDVIIHTDGGVTKRKKKASRGLKGDYGHTPLSEYELDILKGEKPERVFIGTGQYGSLPLTPGAKQLLGEYPAVILPTPEVLPLLEAEKRPYMAILHVTC